jgi:TolA-binding protein
MPRFFHYFFRLPVPLLLGSILTGCLVTRDQIRSSETPRGAAFGGTSPEKASGEVASTQARVAELEAFVRELNGRLGSLDNEFQEKTKSLEVASQTKWSEIENRLNAVVEELGIIKTELGNRIRLLTEARASSQAAASAGQAAATAAASASEFDQAEKLFSEKKWQQAILKYQEYRDRNPRGRHFAEATYKIGVCFQELGMNKEAKTFYDEVIARFPNTPQSRRAQTRTRALKP